MIRLKNLTCKWNFFAQHFTNQYEKNITYPLTSFFLLL